MKPQTSRGIFPLSQESSITKSRTQCSSTFFRSEGTSRYCSVSSSMTTTYDQRQHPHQRRNL